ncbi:MAG: outer membrane lipoprotein carrier protein LolA [Gammaproteobacteria bacterium GWE2_37_16]|nr:MAG: outer membrane lipoprotein carrier protein LolA [Gammaproteobacteria bacterium GWE2_37_16]
MKNNFLILKTILFTYLLLFSLLGQAGTATQELETRLQNLNSMQADFVQVLHTRGGKGKGVDQFSSGKMALQRPGKFRWQIEKPQQQLIVADGQNIWIYDIDLQQVTKNKIDYQQTDSPAFLLSGSSAILEKMFSIKKINSATVGQDNANFELRPHSPNAMYNSIKLFFNARQLTKMQIEDNLGQESTLTFTNVRVNSNLPAKLFQFILPQGVDLIKE